MKTYLDTLDFIYSDDQYSYQPDLTIKLDASAGRQADQELINEIALWKINRYAQLSVKALELLNHPTLKGTTLDELFTKTILTELLKTKGIRLPMASTILRFRNPDVYQIMDQRAYRFATGQELVLNDPKLNEKTIVRQIDLYIIYLQKLKEIAATTRWPFSDIDRILYLLDQQHNKDLSIKYA